MSVYQKSKERIKLIENIEKCSFSTAKVCDENSHNYCVWYIKDTFLGQKGVCAPAVCSKAKDEAYCVAIELGNNKGFCFVTKDISGRFLSCKPCSEVKSCSDYGIGGVACFVNRCDVEDTCFRRKQKTGEFSCMGCSEIKNDGCRAYSVYDSRYGNIIPGSVVTNENLCEEDPCKFGGCYVGDVFTGNDNYPDETVSICTK